jgi:hypothetical protein
MNTATARSVSKWNNSASSTLGFEAGVLYTDGTLCETLRINSSLLLAVLAETKTLFEDYATRNGKYEETRGETRWGDQGEPETDLVLDASGIT